MVTIKVVSFVTTCTVFVAFVSVVLQAYLESAHLSKVTALISELSKLEHNIDVKAASGRQPRIAVGYGSCSDLYVSAKALLNFSNIDTTLDQGYLMGDITNENELLQSFAYFFKNGAAAEYVYSILICIFYIFVSIFLDDIHRIERCFNSWSRPRI